MKNFRHAKIAYVLSLALLGVPALAPHATPLAATTSEAVEPQKQGDIEYISGGIGSDEVESFKLAQKSYNLRLTFSSGKNNAYVAGVDLSIRKPHGKTFLKLENAGPLVYVKLPAGKYEVSTSLNDEEKKSIITIGAHGARTMNLHW